MMHGQQNVKFCNSDVKYSYILVFVWTAILDSAWNEGCFSTIFHQLYKGQRC